MMFRWGIGRILRWFASPLKPFGPAGVTVPTKITVPKLASRFVVPRRE